MVPRFRIRWLAAILLGFSVLPFLAGCRKPVPRNLLLITLDTTRADYLSCYRGAGSTTPALDGLAADGVLFRRCSSCSPTTLPSHASIMTGLLPPSHGARRNASDRLGEASETLAEALGQAGYRTAAVVASFVLHSKFGLAQGFDTYSEVAARISGVPLRAERRGDEVADGAIELLGSLASERFFLWVHFYDPHYPYLSSSSHPPDSSAAYAEEIAFMDAQIGRILAELERLGLGDSTLVVAVGDHGESLYEHEELTHGYFLYDATIQVPLILRAPGVAPSGKVVEQPVRTIDVAPTVLELLQAPPLPNAQGRSLAASWKAKGFADGAEAYAETISAHVLFRLAVLRSLSVGRWKYIHAPEPELYDVRADPREERNLWSREPQRGRELQDRLERLLQELPHPPERTEGPSLSPEDEEALLALGYVAEGEGTHTENDLDRFAPEGGNPRDHARAFQINTAWRRAREEGDHVAAERLCRQLLVVFPDSPLVRLGLARDLRAQKRFDEAIGLCREVLADWPDEVSCRHELAELLGETGRLEESRRELEGLLLLKPRMTGSMYSLGILLARMGHLEEAARQLEAGLEIEPANPRLLHARGTVHTMTGRFDLAAESYRRAFESDPSCQRCQGDHERALAESRRGEPGLEGD